MIRLSLTLMALATPALAQEYPVDRDAVLACFDATAGNLNPPGCIGAAAEMCMERSEGGYTTVGMASCVSSETAIWDELLNTVYGDLRADMGALDADDTNAGRSRVEALRDAQRAWIAFRDADCAFNWAIFQEGTMRSLVSTGCMLDMTADRVLELHSHLEAPY
ncbi:lysozyme inhibitor LprI family protein [Yoonia sp. BS5-3]|uniref:Lysozyme inhibitor LprI family protein n=1 Tax=Yoonia phaeophyticola TaxID=3137369 RepID=A0ABZ2V3D4_9RHOB